MSVMRGFFLAFSVWGAVYPFIQFGGWFSIDGASPYVALALWQEGQALGHAQWSLLMSSIVMSVWMLTETYARKNWPVLVCLPVLWIVGVACGLPLFLYLRTARFAPR